MGIEQQEQTALALRLEQFGMPFAAARGTPPINVARVVARLIDARFGIVHAAPTQRRNVTTGQRRTRTHPRDAGPARACAQGDQFRKVDARDAVYGR